MQRNLQRLTHHCCLIDEAVVRKKDGTSIYLTRDIGGVFERTEKYGFDRMIYVIANQQDLHMAQLIKIIALMGREDLAGKLQHINFGLVNGMSTRRGTVKFLDDTLRDAAGKVDEVMKTNESNYVQIESLEMVADILGISAVLVQDMSGKRYVFPVIKNNRRTKHYSESTATTSKSIE
jgi:arginyl-tRNA synthetase